MSGNFYRAFEDRYRGSRELIKSRLAAYAPFTQALARLHAGAPILDLGCGRGEWLEMMAAEGFDASGVDLDDGMLAACRERGLKVRTADALTTLRDLPDASVAMVSAFHLVEHLPFDVVQTMIAESLRVLMPGGLLIMETPNPENIIVGTNNFYLDPSHIKPVPPILLDFMADYAGFLRHRIVRLARGETDVGDAVGLRQVLQDVSADYAVVAQKLELIADDDALGAAFAAEYGDTLDVLADRFDQGIAGMRGDTEARLGALSEQAGEHDALLTRLGEASNELWNRALPSLDQGVAALDQGVAALDHSMATLNQGVAALDRGVIALDQNVAALDQNVGALVTRVEQVHIDARTKFDATDVRLAQAFGHIEQMKIDTDVMGQAAAVRMNDATLKIDQVSTESAAVSKIMAMRLDEADATAKAMEDRLMEALARLEQRTGERLQQNERRQAQSDRRAAPLTLRLEQAEIAVAAAAARAQNAEAHATTLQYQINALMASSSWRITAPARWLVGAPRRLTSAWREDRIKSGLLRRLSSLLLGSAHPENNASLRGWLRRAKDKTWIRRIVLPLLQRFPQLRAPLRRLAGIATPQQPSGDIMLPDWPTPLPADYLAMPVSSRKVLLDLARARPSSTHP